VFIDGVFFALTGAALFVLHRKRPDADRPVRVPGYPVVPLVFVIGEVVVVAGSYVDPEVRSATVIGVGWLAAAAALYEHARGFVRGRYVEASAGQAVASLTEHPPFDTPGR
jgi:amino acid transporter